LEWAELGSAIEGRSVASVSLEIWLVKLQVISGNPRDPRVDLGMPSCEIVSCWCGFVFELIALPVL
jgi:hypothetical protein